MDYSTTETDSLQLKNYGCTSPVFVREALESLCDSTVRYLTPSFGLDSATNHCWLFINRQVYVWNFKSLKNSCDGLPLPQTGLKYTANLFATFPPKNKPNIISFLCVSPEGNLRLWRKHDNPSDYVDLNLDLGGQVAETVTKITDQDAFLLVTSTCNLFVLKIAPESSKLLSVTALKSGQDAMTSFSRRFSSFLFSAPSITNDNKLCGFATITDQSDNNSCLSVVLTSKSLLCWQIFFSNNEYKLLWEYDMDKIIINQAIKSIWPLNDPQAISRFRMSVSYAFLDCEYYDGEIYILIALTNRSYSTDIHYILCSYADLHASPSRPSKFIRLNKINDNVDSVGEINFPQYKVRHMHGSSDVFFISDTKIVKYDTEAGDCARLEVEISDRILGSGSYATEVLIFTLSNGLHCVKIDGKQNGSTVFVEEMSIMHNLEKLQSDVSMSGRDVDSDNILNHFKRAFLLYLKQKLPESEKTLQEIIQKTTNSKYQLADLIVQFAYDILDGYPSTDARWSKIIDQDSGNIRLPTTASLLISHQLENKKQTFDLYVEFLKRMGFFKKVHLVKNPIDSLRKIHVQLILNECREKLCACLAVFEKDYPEVQPYLKSALANILKARKEPISHELAYQDQFFRKVSNCESLITALIDELKTQLITQNEECLPVDKLCIIGQYILDFLSGSAKCRVKYAPSVYQSFEIALLMDEQGVEEYFPTLVPSYWTSPDQSPLNRSLHELWSLLVQYLKEWSKSSDDFKRSANLAKLLSDLVTHLLNDMQLTLLYWTNKRKNEQLSREKIDEYNNLRRKLIEPLLTTSHHDHAARLAENFQDFDILIELCKLTKDDLLLERYRTKFADKNFEKSIDHWLLKQKKYDQLLDRRPEELTPFLDATNRSDLLWISHVVNSDFLKASYCLHEISVGEKESISKKKTLLSIAKLAALSADENVESHVDNINKELDLITFQEQAPSSALQNYFHGEEMLKPMTALEIVEMYTLDPEATEISFLKAVELLANCCAQRDITEEEFIKRKTKLWARAILRDEWTSIIGADEPLKASKSTLFARTVDFLVDLFSKGSIPLDFVQTVLPDADLLIECQELENYGENSVFQYILKAGQEMITQSLKTD